MFGDEQILRGRLTRHAHETGDGSDGGEGGTEEETAGLEVETCALASSPSFDGIELRILELMGCGLPDAVIAKRLALSHRTVQRRVQRMMVRTGVCSRFSFGLRVSELGLLRPEEQ